MSLLAISRPCTCLEVYVILMFSKATVTVSPVIISNFCLNSVSSNSFMPERGESNDCGGDSAGEDAVHSRDAIQLRAHVFAKCAAESQDAHFQVFLI